MRKKLFFLIIFLLSLLSPVSARDDFPEFHCSRQMRCDPVPRILAGLYPEINLFSTAHYGRVFIAGEVTLGDIFDARDPENMKIFLEYAACRRIPPGCDRVGRYSRAAHQFLEEFAYDAVLFRPDEYHPLYTRPDDTWLFVRDCPGGIESSRYFSERLSRRQAWIFGGIAMEPGQSPEDGEIYYVPCGGVSYIPFGTGPLPFPQAEAEDFPTSGYRPESAGSEALEKRRRRGLSVSPLSGRTVAAGAWKSETGFRMLLERGFLLKNDPYRNTWGGYGIYLLPLSADFWKEPQ